MGTEIWWGKIRAIFCDVSKTLDHVWHKDLLYKLKHKRINETLLQVLASNLSNRKQRVVIPGACSEWVAITAGVPQGFIIGTSSF